MSTSKLTFGNFHFVNPINSLASAAADALQTWAEML
jgi:hypothetical protein